MVPPIFCEVTDTDGVVHLVSMWHVARVDVLGTEQNRQLEIWIQFGGMIRLDNEQAAWFLEVMDNRFGHVHQRPRPQASDQA